MAHAHHVYTERWSKIVDVARDAGLSVISPTLSVREFLERLAGCSRVYCESLHAAIFADALRIPWTRVRISSHYYEGDGVSEFKWRDAFSITDVPTQSAIREVLIPIRRRVMRRASNTGQSGNSWNVLLKYSGRIRDACNDSANPIRISSNHRGEAR